MTDLVMNYLNLADLAVPDAVIAAGRGGFRATGIRLTGHQPGEPGLGLVGDCARRQALTRIAADAGVALAVMSTYRILPERRLDDYLPVLDAGAELGIPTMALNCFDPEEDRAVALLGAIAGPAAERGISLALEFIPVSAVRTLEDAARVLTATGADNVGINVDALHLRRSGGGPADLARIPGRLVHSIHLCDAPLKAPPDLFAEMRAGRLYPGEGDLPLHAILDAAPPSVELEVEVPNAALAHLPPEERARRAFAATTAFLERHAARTRTAD